MSLSLSNIFRASQEIVWHFSAWWHWQFIAGCNDMSSAQTSVTPLFCLVREALTNMKKSLEQEIVDLKQKIQELREIYRMETQKWLCLSPGTAPSFSCYKTASHIGENKIAYTDCTVTTEGMDKNTGIFTVKQGGTYQFTFTGFIASIRGHMVAIPLAWSDIEQFLSRWAQTSTSGGATGTGSSGGPPPRRTRTGYSVRRSWREVWVIVVFREGRWPSHHRHHRPAGDSPGGGRDIRLHGHTRRPRDLENRLRLL